MREASGLEPDVLERIDSVFAEYDGDDVPGAALGIYQDGTIVHTRGYGQSNLEHGIPVSPSSVFHVASLSKEFAAHCVTLLAKEGKLSLSDDIRTYFPEIPDYGETITIQHLIHHTSGLRDQWDLLELAGWREDDLITDEDAFEICVRQRALNFAPGSRYSYSNTGYTLLGLIVKKVTGQSLRDFAHDRIFEPLGMASTHFHNNHNEIVAGRTHGYEPLKDGAGWRVSNPVFDTTGATSLHTTVEDFAAWDRYLASWLTDPVNAHLVERCVLTDGEEIPYGCGLAYGKIGEFETVGHSGADAGYRAHYTRIPERDLAVTVFCNRSTASPARLVESVIKILLEIEPDESSDAEPVTLSHEELARVTGVYQDSKTMLYQEVHLEDGELTLPMLWDTKLEALATNRFRTLGMININIEFELAGDGPASKMSFGEHGEFHRAGDSGSSPSDLSQYAGTFVSEELRTDYQFAPEDGKLMFKRYRFEPKPLRYLIEDTYSSSGATFVFERDANGQVTGLRLNTGRSQGMYFERVGPAS